MFRAQMTDKIQQIPISRKAAKKIFLTLLNYLPYFFFNFSTTTFGTSVEISPP